MKTDAYLNLLKETLTGAIYPESSWELLRDTTRTKSSRGVVRALLGAVYSACFHKPVEIKGDLLRWAIKSCDLQNMAIVRKRALKTEDIIEGREWPLFGYTMVGSLRLENVRQCVDEVQTS